MDWTDAILIRLLYFSADISDTIVNFIDRSRALLTGGDGSKKIMEMCLHSDRGR